MSVHIDGAPIPLPEPEDHLGAPVEHIEAPLPDTLVATLPEKSASPAPHLARLMLGDVSDQESDALLHVCAAAQACVIVDSAKKVTAQPSAPVSIFKKPKPPMIDLEKDGEEIEPVGKKSVHFAANDKLFKTVTQPEKVPEGIVKKEDKIFLDYLKHDRSKSYLYKTLGLLDQLYDFLQEPNLYLQDVELIKLRLNQIGTCAAYQSRSDLGAPQGLAWPPIGKLSRRRTSTLEVEIRQKYAAVYGQLLSKLEKLNTEAKRTCDAVAQAEIQSLMDHKSLFPFEELLMYAVVTNHVQFVSAIVENFEERVLETVKPLMDSPDEYKLNFMITYGLDAFRSIHDICFQFFILHDLEQESDANGQMHIITDFIEKCGDVLHRGDDDLDLVNAYSQSEKCHPEVLSLLCERAQAQIDHWISKLEKFDEGEISDLCKRIRYFSEVEKLPKEFAGTLLKSIDTFQKRASELGIKLSDRSNFQLLQAKTHCR